MFKKYIGTVTAKTYYVDDNGNKIPGSYTVGHWVLTEGPFGGRYAKKFGFVGRSESAILKTRSVEVWLNGGPLPELDKETAITESEPPKFNVIENVDFGKKPESKE